MLVLSLGIPAVVFVIAGAWLSKFLDARVLQLSLALFLIVVSLLLLIFRNLAVKPTLFSWVTGGIFSGFVAGLLGTGGAIRGITLASFRLKMGAFITTSAIIDLAIDSSRSIVYTLNGYVHRHDLYLIPILLGVSIAGTFAGKWILKRMSDRQFRAIVLVLVLITGVATLTKALMH
jgi:uncharacterized protein